MEPEFHLQARYGNGQEANYGGVDWRELRLQRLAETAVKSTEIWLVCDDEYYEQRLNQDNTFIHINRTHAGMDRLMFVDERDKTEAWRKYRTDLEEFDKYLELAKYVGFIVATKYPEPDVVEVFLQRESYLLDQDLYDFERGYGDE